MLAKGTRAEYDLVQGDDHRPEHLPGDAWPEQAYVQIDLVGQFTAAAGCAIYDGGAWPDKWRYSYFTGEPVNQRRS